MFHKHDDRLQRLNEELLAEDEEYYEEEYDESDELSEADLAELLGEEEEELPFFQNHANGYGRDIRNYANHYGKGSPTRFDDEDMQEYDDLEDEEFLYRDDYRHAKKHKKKEAPQQKKGGILWAVLAIIELIAIGGILAGFAVTLPILAIMLLLLTSADIVFAEIPRNTPLARFCG